MKYVYIREGIVYEIIPELDHTFPDIPLAERYPAQFLAELIAVEEDANAQCNMLYDAETNEFRWPEPPEAPEPVEIPGAPADPTPEERNRADIDYIALMLGVELL